MAEAVMESKELTVTRLADLARQRVANGPSWLDEIRLAAADHFEAVGFPTRRDEPWRYTDIRPIASSHFVPADTLGVSLTKEQLDELRFVDFGCPRMVFVNGNLSEEHSIGLDRLPSGITVRSLANAIGEGDGLKGLLGGLVDPRGGAFSALNMAFLNDGAVIDVARGTVVEEPILLLFVSVNRGEEPILIAPRVLINAAENSQVTVIESHIGAGSGPYLSCGVTEVYAKASTVVDHYKLQLEKAHGFHVATVQSNQGRSSNVRLSTATLTGGIVRNEVNSELAGEGAWAELDGLFLVGDDHHVDNFTRIDHLQPHCDSREVYKGILADKSTGVFRGRIVVAEGAQKTDSKQTNNNLLLSDNALINTKPQLEIYADDVKCTHGATVGQLEADAIFYLQARGISKNAAKSMLIYAFASEVVSRIKAEALRNELDSYLFEWLPKGDVVKAAF